jgi:hypothetical protein
MDYFGSLLLLSEVELIDTVEGIIYVSATVLALLLLAYQFLLIEIQV